MKPEYSRAEATRKKQFEALQLAHQRFFKWLEMPGRETPSELEVRHKKIDRLGRSLKELESALKPFGQGQAGHDAHTGLLGLIRVTGRENWLFDRAEYMKLFTDLVEAVEAARIFQSAADLVKRGRGAPQDRAQQTWIEIVEGAWSEVLGKAPPSAKNFAKVLDDFDEHCRKERLRIPPKPGETALKKASSSAVKGSNSRQ